MAKSYKDPAAMIAAVGVAAFTACVAAAVPSGVFIASHLKQKYATAEATALSARHIIQEAAELGTGLLAADALWADVKSFALATFPITEPDFEETRRRYDSRAAAAHAKQISHRFVTDALAVTTVAEMQMFINAAKGDDTVIAALAQLHLDGARLDVVLGALMCKHGCKTTVKELIRAAADEARRIRAHTSGRPVLRSNSHVATAEAVIEQLGTRYDALVVSEETLYGFADGHYRPIASQELSSVVAELDGAMYVSGEKANGQPEFAELRLREPDISGVAKVVYSSTQIYAPGFFDDTPRGVAFADAFVWVTDDGELVVEPLSPAQKQRARYPFEWAPNATTPVHDDAMLAWTGDTPDGARKRQFLAEWSGAALVGASTDFQRAVLLLGPPGTGKSSFMQVEEAMFPPGSVSHVDPQEMSSDVYQAADLLGARLNLAFDIPATEIVESSMLKKVIVGDPITVRQIRKEPVTFRPRAGQMFSANDLPPFRDRSGAVQDRFVPIMFDQRFRGQAEEVRDLGGKIIAQELPGIVAKALHAFQDLVSRGEFIIPASSQAALDGWTRGNEPIAIWLMSNLAKPSFVNGRVANVQALYPQFAAWAQSLGYRPPNLTNFEKRLADVVDPVAVWAATQTVVLPEPEEGLSPSYTKQHGTAAAACYRDYSAWAKSSGLVVPSATAFGRALAKIVPKQQYGNVYYLLRLKAHTAAAQARPRVFVYDTETALITSSEAHPDLICGGWTHDGAHVTLGRAADVVEVVRGALAAGDTVVGHNVAFDNAVVLHAADDPALEAAMFAAYGAGHVSDTMIREMLIRNAAGKFPADETSLSDLASKYAGMTLTKGGTSWQTRFGALANVDPSQWPSAAKTYVANDVIATSKAHDAQSAAWPEIPDEGPQTRAAFALHLTERHGVVVNQLGLRQLIADFDADIATIQNASPFFREDGTRDLTSVQEAVSVAYGEHTPLTERSGEPRTNRETLASSGDPDLEQLAVLEEKKKLRGLAKTLVDAGPVVRCHYTPLVASGRVSCSSPNLQQVPRDGGLRENVVPREGHVFVIADYKTLELCTLAQFCLDEFGESHMADLLQQGLDLHLNVAAKLLGITYEEALARRDDPEIKEHRRLAKGLNFGLPGGLGPDALVEYLRGYDFDIDRGRAAELKNEWLASYPEMQKLFAWAQRQVRNGLATIEQPRSGRLRGGTKYTAACNTVFQGLAADGAKEALWRVVKECRTVPSSPLYGSHPVIFVHDEIVLEAPATTYQAAASRLEVVMVEGMRVFTPDIPINVDIVAADCWSKDAQHLVDSNGDLLVWRHHA